MPYVASIQVTCVYRLEDPDKLDLLTLEKPCESGDVDTERRLQDESGLGVQFELSGQAVKTIQENAEAAEQADADDDSDFVFEPISIADSVA